jgi:Sulfate permease family
MPSCATRTAIAVSTGSRTQVYSLATAASAVVVLLFLRPVLARFPTAALGAIVVYAAIQLIDVTAFRRLLAFRRMELLIAVSACIGALAFNILYGVLVAIELSVATCSSGWPGRTGRADARLTRTAPAGAPPTVSARSAKTTMVWRGLGHAERGDRYPDGVAAVLKTAKAAALTCMQRHSN